MGHGTVKRPGVVAGAWSGAQMGARQGECRVGWWQSHLALGRVVWWGRGVARRPTPTRGVWCQGGAVAMPVGWLCGTREVDPMAGDGCLGGYRNSRDEPGTAVEEWREADLCCVTLDDSDQVTFRGRAWCCRTTVEGQGL